MKKKVLLLKKVYRTSLKFILKNRSNAHKDNSNFTLKPFLNAVQYLHAFAGVS